MRRLALWRSWWLALGGRLGRMTRRLWLRGARWWWWGTLWFWWGALWFWWRTLWFWWGTLWFWCWARGLGWARRWFRWGSTLRFSSFWDITFVDLLILVYIESYALLENDWVIELNTHLIRVPFVGLWRLGFIKRRFGMVRILLLWCRSLCYKTSYDEACWFN